MAFNLFQNDRLIKTIDERFSFTLTDLVNPHTHNLNVKIPSLATSLSWLSAACLISSLASGIQQITQTPVRSSQIEFAAVWTMVEQF